MALKLIVPPAVEPVSLEEAKLHCRVEVDTDDDLISSLIITAREYCEGFQRRAYCEQTWELWLDAFPKVGQLMIPRPPLISVDPIKYYDVDDVEHEFDPANYFVDIKNEPGWVILNYGAAWPTEILRPANGVCITFVAGYESEEEYEVTNVPQKVKQAILLLVSHWYENREATGTNINDIPKGVDSLLWQDRNF